MRQATYLSAPLARSPALRARFSRLPGAPQLLRGSVSRGARRLPRAGSAAAAAARSPRSSAFLLAGGSSSASRSGPAPPLLSVSRSPLALPTPLLLKFVSLG